MLAILVIGGFFAAPLLWGNKVAQAACNLCATSICVFGACVCPCVPGGSYGGKCKCSLTFKEACNPIPAGDCIGMTISRANLYPAHLLIIGGHIAQRDLQIKLLISDFMENYREWFAKDFFDKYIRQGLKELATHMSATTLQQAYVIGTFFDAKQSLEVQRTLQELEYKAVHDYTPSEGVCAVGTGVRNLAATESRARMNSLSLNKHALARHVRQYGTSGAYSREADKRARWENFKTTYCDPQDNRWRNYKDDKGNPIPSGLMWVCGNDGGGKTERINIDVDYTRLIDQNSTLNIDLDDPNATPPTDRMDVMALANNLYGHDVLADTFNTNTIGSQDFQSVVMDLRAVAAKRNVAENSFNAIIELKSSGGTDKNNDSSSRPYLAAMLSEIGMSAQQITNYIGENPSYYAQLEILAKKIYQNPDFYADLYDTPANVERKSIMLKAIELMLDRAIYESELRQEMVTSVLLSTSMDNQVRSVRNRVEQKSREE